MAVSKISATPTVCGKLRSLMLAYAVIVNNLINISILRLNKNIGLYLFYALNCYLTFRENDIKMRQKSGKLLINILYIFKLKIFRKG